jgi:hypothetical protein
LDVSAIQARLPYFINNRLISINQLLLLLSLIDSWRSAIFPSVEVLPERQIHPNNMKALLLASASAGNNPDNQWKSLIKSKIHSYRISTISEVCN